MNWWCWLGCCSFPHNGPIWCVMQLSSYWSLTDEDRDPCCMYVYMCIHKTYTDTYTEFNLHHPLHWSLMIKAVTFQTLIGTMPLCMHDAWNVKSCKINSSLHITLDITYIASAPALCTNSTESRRYDDVATKKTRTLSVAYDCQFSPHQNWTDTTSCKENDLVSSLYFHLALLC
jgi:hypothetical protein